MAAGERVGGGVWLLPRGSRHVRQRISFCTTTDGVRIAYAQAGQGPALLRVGGWLTHVEHDWESPVWRPWLRELTRDFTLTRFDIRGSGLSDQAVSEQSLEAWVRDLEAVADSLGDRPFPLLGICQGAPIAVAYASRHPERVSRLVLYNAYTNGAFTDGSATHKKEEAEALARMIEIGWGRRTGAFRELFARLLSPGKCVEHIGWWDELQRISTSPGNALRLWRGFHEIDVRDTLAAVRCPALIAHVEGDAMVPFELGRSLAAQLPDACFLPLQGDNHILRPEDGGWRVFFDEMRRFLSDDPTAGGTSAGPFCELTRRERLVLDRVARGLTNAEIAQSLSIAGKTVRNHVSNICSKLDIASRAQLIVRAREAGFGSD